MPITVANGSVVMPRRSRPGYGGSRHGRHHGHRAAAHAKAEEVAEGEVLCKLRTTPPGRTLHTKSGEHLSIKRRCV